MRLILIAFGEKLEVYHQACFCILSYLKESAPVQIHVYTDQPKYFSLLKGAIRIENLDRERLQDWQGEMKYFWRFKIKAMEDIAKRYLDEHLVLVDADTFLATGFCEFKQMLDSGCGLMHENEGFISQSLLKRQKSMWRTLGGKTIGSVPVSETSEMWNAGVVAIPGSLALDTIQLALQLCDAMCKKEMPRDYLEQFAFSLALKQSCSSIAPADSWVGHYWGNKNQWNQFINEFFLSTYFQGLNLEQCIIVMMGVDFTQLPLKTQATKKWLSRLIKSLTRRYTNKPLSYYQNYNLSP